MKEENRQINIEHGISVVINTYNASQHLAEVLETVKDFDEVVICDMESTDNTLDIARKYGCKIVIFPRGNYQICEPARQTAIDAASCKWVLVVDADELVTPEGYRMASHHSCRSCYQGQNRKDTGGSC